MFLDQLFGLAVTDRLAQIYSQNNGYKEGIDKETKLYLQLKESLTEEQMEIVDKYHAAICSTMGMCELLAYRQGMRDLYAILSGK